MSEEIGTVVSTLDGPSPSCLDFVVNSGVIHRGQFVEIDYSEGTLIALVNDVVKTNRYFERAESVKEFESNGRKLLEQFPTTEWEYLLAKTRPLGVYSNGLIKRPTYPPSPGTKVKVAKADTLKNFLGFDETGLNLGEIEYHNLPVNLNLSRLLRKHLAVLAMSGAGKSHFVSVLLEELLERDKSKGRISAVLFDSHGEYSGFEEPQPGDGKKDYSGKTKIIRSRDIKIGIPKLSASDFSALIPRLSGPQKRDLNNALNGMKKEMKSGSGPFNLQMLINYIVKNEEGKKTASTLSAWLSELSELNLFGKTDSFSIADVVKPGILTVIDLSDEINVKRKQIIVSYFLRKLFYERKKKVLPPLVAILEESHQFAPEGTKYEAAIAKGIIETIAREGRKFGISVCLISQRPKRLSTTALSQCGTHIILRITNPYDLKHIGESSEALDSRSTDMITSLRVGEAVIVGEATNYPLFFKVRGRKSLESKHEIPLEEAAKRFEKGKEKEEKETGEFL